MSKKLPRGFWRTARTATGVSLMTTTARRNDTRIAEYQGLKGTRKESSWSKPEHQHDCCGSKVSWRHKVSCQKMKGVCNA